MRSLTTLVFFVLNLVLNLVFRFSQSKSAIINENRHKLDCLQKTQYILNVQTAPGDRTCQNSANRPSPTGDTPCGT